MRLILISGKARSGKTMLASLMKEYLEENHKKVVITEFSKYIKLFAKEFLGWDGVSEPKPRKFLQDFGYFIRHEFRNSHYFIDRMKEDLEIYEHFFDIVIISDVRLEEEIRSFQNDHPITIRVSHQGESLDLDETEKIHETEIALDQYTGFQYLLENQSVEEMKATLKEIVRKEGLL